MTLKHAFYKFLWRQPWLNRRARLSVYKRLSKIEAAPDAPFTTDFFGLRYQGNLNNSIEFNIYFFEAFEKPLLFFLRDALQKLQTGDTPAVFADIGANIGQHSLFMSRHAEQVYAFEPYALVRDKLQFHIELNQISNIDVHPVGLSEHSEELPFYAPTGHNQGIGSFDASTVSKGNKAVGKLALVNGDDYFASLQALPPTIVKIDVEGFEKHVLNGLRDTLSSARPLLVIEITYGEELSFVSAAEFEAALPPNYQLFTFNTRKSDGSKARKRGARAKRSGEYELVPFTRWLTTGQDDVVACPQEKVALLPRRGPVATDDYK